MSVAAPHIFSADAVDPGRRSKFAYWLGECEGFRVESPRGRVGIIGKLRRDRAGNPSALIVLVGALGRKRVIGVEDVARIVPRESRVVLRPQARIGLLDSAVRPRKELTLACAPKYHC